MNGNFTCRVVRLHMALAWALFSIGAGSAMAAEVHPPALVEAGHAFSFPTEGSGSATLYFIGPDRVFKRSVNLGATVEIESSDVRAAGRYELILCQQSCTSSAFDVRASQPEHLSFFLHPSRVPVSLPDSIDATVFVFDQYFNLDLRPAAINFQIAQEKQAGPSHPVSSRDGVAWIHMNSSPREGLVRVTASIGQVSEVRVIQQVAAEACRLHMSATQSGGIATLSTDPVRDCSGNHLPDGTIVSFTMVDGAGRSTVDTPIKKGIAQTKFPVAGPTRISVACGVVLGNEVSLNGKL